MNIKDIAKKCAENLDLSSENKAVRQFLQCVLSQIGVKHVAIDNGLRYNFLIYIEVSSKSDMKRLIDDINRALDILVKVTPQNLTEYLSKRKILDWKNEVYLLLSKEFVVVKYVIK